MNDPYAPQFLQERVVMERAKLLRGPNGAQAGRAYS